ncbi:UNVERIFIED_CONTAM: hypothetical protein Sradi_6213100 [Sesamum radiatum]|uniref:Reverse transcriptase n=1 Tax=Sesamum radiatum TaxID=300843 RepID=A0AAW2K9P2_SESRA
MKIGFWNVRGFNWHLKHNGVAYVIKNNQLCLLDILETKLIAPAIPRIIHRSFPRWWQTNNFDTIADGRILVIWNHAVIDLHPEDISPQVIHCCVTNNSSQLSFYISFTYGLYTVVNRMSIWEKLLKLGKPLNHSDFIATFEDGWSLNMEGIHCLLHLTPGAVKDFFRMLRQLSHTIIALVPKSEHSPSVADYRPISCCNVIYNAITKIIADRFSPALEHLIDSCQAAFVGGQNVIDNIFLA